MVAMLLIVVSKYLWNKTKYNLVVMISHTTNNLNSSQEIEWKLNFKPEIL